MESLEDRRLLAAVSWDAGGDGRDFLDPLNWSGDLVPSAVDDVTIDLDTGGQPFVVELTSDQHVNSLRIASDDAEVVLRGHLTVNDEIRVDQGFLNAGASITANSLDNDDQVHVADPRAVFDIERIGNRGDFRVARTTSVGLTIDGTLHNFGTFELQPGGVGSGTLTILNGSLINESSGSMIIGGEGDFRTQNILGNVDNRGQFEFLSRFINYTQSNASLSNSGSMLVSSNTRLSTFNNQTVFEQTNGELNVLGDMLLGDGAYNVQGGTVDIQGLVRINSGNVLLAGGHTNVDGSLLLDQGGDFGFSGGSYSGANPIRVLGSTDLTITHDSPIHLHTSGSTNLFGQLFEGQLLEVIEQNSRVIVQEGFENHGSLVFNNPAASGQTLAAVEGIDFFNGPTGELLVTRPTPSSSIATFFNTSITNLGTIRVDAIVSDARAQTFSNLGNFVVTQNGRYTRPTFSGGDGRFQQSTGGTMRVETGGRFDGAGLELDVQGGESAGVFSPSRLNLGTNRGGGSGGTIWIPTRSISGTVLPGEELIINSALETTGEVANDGLINISTGGSSTVQIDATLGGILNRGVTRILGETTQSSFVFGNFANQGTVEIGIGSSKFDNFVNQAGAPGRGGGGRIEILDGNNIQIRGNGTYIQTGGSLNIGTGSFVVSSGGLLQYEGGVINGVPSLVDASLSMSSGVGGAEFSMNGGGILRTNVPAGVAVSLGNRDGGGGGAGGAIYVGPDDMVINGTLNLGDSATTGPVTLEVNGDVSVGPTGSLLVEQGNGERRISGSLDNRGGGIIRVSASSVSFLGSSHANQGDFSIANGSAVTFAGERFENRSGGTLRGSGVIAVTGSSQNDGLFQNSAVVIPDQSQGMRVQASQFEQRSGGAIWIQHDPIDGAGRLTVEGNASLAGEFRTIPKGAGGGGGAGGRLSFEAVSANGITGGFDSVIHESSLVGGPVRVNQTPTSVIVDFAPDATDTSISNFQVDEPLVSGASFDFSVLATNDGGTSARGLVGAAIFISDRPEFDSLSSVLVGRVEHDLDLPIGQTTVLNGRASMPGVIFDRPHLHYVFNSNGALPEVVMDDNIVSTQVAVQTPELQLGEFQNDTIAPGEARYYVVQLDDPSSLLRYKVTASDPDSIESTVVYNRVHSGDDFDDQCGTAEDGCDFDASQSGYAIVRVANQGDSEVTYLIEVATSELKVTGQSTDEVRGKATIVYEGSGFTPDVTASLVLDGEEIPVQTRFVSNDRIEIVVDGSTVDSRLYGVRFRNDASFVTLESSLRVGESISNTDGITASIQTQSAIRPLVNTPIRIDVTNPTLSDLSVGIVRVDLVNAVSAETGESSVFFLANGANGRSAIAPNETVSISTSIIATGSGDVRVEVADATEAVSKSNLGIDVFDTQIDSIDNTCFYTDDDQAVLILRGSGFDSGELKSVQFGTGATRGVEVLNDRVAIVRFDPREFADQDPNDAEDFLPTTLDLNFILEDSLLNGGVEIVECPDCLDIKPEGDRLTDEDFAVVSKFHTVPESETLANLGAFGAFSSAGTLEQTLLQRMAEFAEADFTAPSEVARLAALISEINDTHATLADRVTEVDDSPLAVAEFRQQFVALDEWQADDATEIYFNEPQDLGNLEFTLIRNQADGSSESLGVLPAVQIHPNRILVGLSEELLQRFRSGDLPLDAYNISVRRVDAPEIAPNDRAGTMAIQSSSDGTDAVIIDRYFEERGFGKHIGDGILDTAFSVNVSAKVYRVAGKDFLVYFDEDEIAYTPFPNAYTVTKDGENLAISEPLDDGSNRVHLVDPESGELVGRFDEDDFEDETRFRTLHSASDDVTEFIREDGTLGQQYKRNERRQVTQITKDVGQTIDIAYDASNRASSSVDSDGNSVSYQYSRVDGAAAELLTTVVVNGIEFVITYDSKLNYETVVNTQTGEKFEFHYDSLGFLIDITSTEETQFRTELSDELTSLLEAFSDSEFAKRAARSEKLLEEFSKMVPLDLSSFIGPLGNPTDKKAVVSPNLHNLLTKLFAVSQPPQESGSFITGFAGSPTLASLPIDVGEFTRNLRAALPGVGAILGSQEIALVQSFDPNDILGPEGVGPGNHVRKEELFDYTIRFENLDTATAAAQQVFVTQTLDEDFDLDTFELQAFGWGDLSFDVPAGQQSYQTRIDLRPTLNLLVEVNAKLDVATRELSWTFRSLDPLTGDLTSDALAGFLPPNVVVGDGEGFVRYRVNPKQSLSSGDRLDAEARIVFDTNEAIDTPAIFNTIDSGLPTATIDALPAITNTEAFQLSWTGSDEAGGSGIASYDIFVSRDGLPFVPFIVATPETSASFVGEDGRSYAFRVTATDAVGFVEDDPGTADTSTVIRLNAPPVASDDSYSVDEDAELIGNVTANDSDPYGDTLVVTLLDGTSSGSLQLNSDGSFEYLPNADFNGADQFSYVVTDPSGESSSALVSITVNPVNDGPQVNGPIADITVDEDASPHVIALANVFGDIDSEDIELSVTTGDSGLVLAEIEGQELTLEFLPNSNGTTSVTVTASDGEFTAQDIFVVTVNAVNDAPVAGDDLVSTLEDQGLGIDVLANDSDVDSSTLTIEILTFPNLGSATVTPQGSIFYRPDSNVFGSDSLTYSVTDEFGASSTASVSVEVLPVNDAPVTNVDSFDVVIGQQATLDVLQNDIDIDGEIDASSVSIVTEPNLGSLQVNPDGTLVYLAGSTSGTDGFTYRVSDDQGLGSTLTTVQINVLSGSDPSGRAVLRDGTLVVRGSKGDDNITVRQIDQHILVEFTQQGAQTLEQEFAASDVRQIIARLRKGNDFLDLRGLDYPSIVYAGAGNDVVYGGAGRDAIYGGRGHDWLYGNQGSDKITGGRGSDLIHGGNGADSLSGNRGNDQISGGRGHDWIFGGRGDDSIHAGAGHDRVFGGSGNDLIFGESGNDWLQGGRGQDIVLGGDGYDWIDGGKGGDVLIGGEKSDVLLGFGGSDLLIGGTTDFDDDVDALRMIHAEWTSPRSYEDRVSNLAGNGSGDRLNGDVVLKTSGDDATVHADHATDILLGLRGADWFLTDHCDFLDDQNNEFHSSN